MFEDCPAEKRLAAVTECAAVAFMDVAVNDGAPVVRTRCIGRVTVEAGAIVGMAVDMARGVIPGTRTDEDAIYKVLRAVISIGRAGVRIIVIVTIGAYRSGAHADGHRARPDRNANANLRIGTDDGEKKNSQQNCIF